MKILIVEDHLVNRFVIEKMLKDYGECDSVVNGKEAVLAFSMAFEEGKPYDIIFLDIMMPEMDGREALKIIRNIEKEENVHASKEVKIVMVTALDTPEEVIDAYYHGGCTNYLVKPINRKKLDAMMKDLNFVKKVIS
ncbi:MAG: response regulator [Bacteroidetes bacterium]|nr:response regulator [Bacteroidota bacterium]MBU1115616.1 response regulator [Bacteroidota bacterium]MBU1799251.1 response regulator [Bacteroidota bacterium]